MTSAARDLAGDMREQAGRCERFGSAFYQAMLLYIAGDVASSGICWRILEPCASDPRRMKLPLRFLAAVHRMVLEGKLPEVARHYPSAGGTGDPEAAWRALLIGLERHGGQIRARLPATVQYSEVKRSCALLPGFLEVARATGLPLRLLELGSSAGLNLRWDSYRYETSTGCWGPPDSPLVFQDAFAGGPPAWDVQVTVAERHGCDLNPVDPTSAGGRLTLQSFLWPDQLDRFERLEAAIEVARHVPAAVDRADVVPWLEAQLSRRHTGEATVVFQSIVLLYLSGEARARVRDILAGAGEHATPEAPLAWLSMEPAESEDQVELTLWPGGARRIVARAGYHGGKVEACSLRS